MTDSSSPSGQLPTLRLRDDTDRPPRWMSAVLLAAAVYNVVWGALTVLYPAWLFRLTGLPEPSYPFIWQCVGMIVGVYGVGYACAARDAYRHWPIVLVGLLGKIFGPMGYVMGLVRGDVPVEFGVTLPTNDLVWWIPFTLILWGAFRHHAGRGLAPRAGPGSIPTPERALEQMRTNNGVSLAELSRTGPVLLVFLRHAGCTFCREALADLRDRRAVIERSGVRLAVVHMDTQDAAAADFLAGYGLDGAARVSDPERRFYQSFELRRGTFIQLFGPSSFARGVVATLRGHRVGRLVGDGFQMPGAFLVRDGRVVASYRHRSASDRPDYVALACPAPTPSANGASA
jgi:peroxiredoxin